MTVVTLLGKPGCHLCDVAVVVVEGVLADYPGVAFEQRSILDDAELFAKYADEIPVVLIDGKVHNIWRIDADRFRAAIQGELT